VWGYFTYNTTITLSAFDSSDSLLAQATSAFGSNLVGGDGDPGSTPNEFLQVATSLAIAKLVIEGDPLGSTFALDDLSARFQPPVVPEPGTLLLLAAGAGLLRYRRSRR
jgi:hypothetical protein